jgi:peptide-methionine (S)-S-oxide reductase
LEMLLSSLSIVHCSINYSATGHTEAVLVLYDPNECTYESLLDTFFSRVDPLTVNGQGSDRGKQYRTGVYHHSEEQEEIAKGRFEMEQQKYPKRKIATEFLQALPFWPAEKYHQQYLEKGGRIGSSQSAKKGCTDTIRCYG